MNKNDIGYEGLVLFLFNGDRDDLLPLRSEDIHIIESSICNLNAKEQNVVRMRFALGFEYHTLREVGKEIGVTQERVRQIEAKALRTLKHPKNIRPMKNFFRSTFENDLERSKEVISKLTEENDSLKAKLAKQKKLLKEGLHALESIDSSDYEYNPSDLEILIDDIEISVRAHNCLKRAGIKTIRDLVQKKEQEMLRIIFK